jgi:tetratricopeptide (TPR) repeat protein
MQLLDEGKELVVQAGLQGGQLESMLMNLEADLCQSKTEYSKARRIQEAILHQTSAVLSPVDHAHALLDIAFLDIVTGASADVVSHNLDVAFAGFQNAQYLRGIYFCEYCYADLLLREGDKIGALAEYMRLFAAARDSDDEIAYYCLTKLADATNPVHEETEYGRWAAVFLAFALRPLVRRPLTIHQALRCFGDVLVGQGADDSALSTLDLALDGFTRMDVHQSRAECMRTMGDVYGRRGDLARAREMWEAALPLFKLSEQKKEVAKIDERLQILGVAQKLKSIPNVQVTLQDSGMDSKEKKPVLIPDM